MNNKETIIASLNDSVNKFNQLINSLDKTQFELNTNNKWSAGQDLVHLVKVLRIVNLSFSLPKVFLRIVFGINKMEIRTIEELKLIYSQAMLNGGKSPSLYIPKPVSFESKEKLVKTHYILNQKFTRKISIIDESALDYYRVPHPILGKITLRELAIFTSFHTVHHLDLLNKKLGK
jgi:hypothetical protein